MIIESLPDIEFSRCIAKIYVRSLSYLSLNLENMPVNIDWPDTIPKKGEGIFLRFTDINVVPKEVFPYVANTIKQINIVMKSLIPEINIEIYNAFDKLLKEGKDGVQFEIIAMRGENRIPLLYESAGIKKLISICSNLVACYNRESYCLVVDELDSGIYEYLLGECFCYTGFIVQLTSLNEFIVKYSCKVLLSSCKWHIL